MVQTSLATWLSKSKTKKEKEHSSEQNEAAEESSQKLSQAAPSTAVCRETRTKSNGEPIPRTPKEKSLVTRNPSIPQNATLSAITAETLPAFRSMTALLLPVPYPNSFFTDIINSEVAANISMVVLWQDRDPKTKPRVVSGIRCRLLDVSPNKTSDGTTLYISTITTLAPFRGHGLATALLREVTKKAVEEYGVVSVTAHMWEANEDVRQWYTKLGFREVLFDPTYYRKIKPTGAYLFEKIVGPKDLLGDDGYDHD